MSFVRRIDWGEGFVKSFLEAGRACFRWRHPDLGLAAAPGDPPVPHERTYNRLAGQFHISE